MNGTNEIDMPIAGATVDVVGSDHNPHKLLKHIEVFVGASGGDQPCNGLASIFGFHISEPSGGKV